MVLPRLSFPCCMLRIMNDELFEPIGVRTATPKFDTSGTQILPREWVDYARTSTFLSEQECYGAHWWMNFLMCPIGSTN